MSTYWLQNLCFSLFLPIFHCKSWFIVKIFQNRKFSTYFGSPVPILEDIFYFRLRTEACAEQQDLQDFCRSRVDVPRVFLALPQWPKSLKTLGTRLAPRPQHLKQVKGKSRKKRRKVEAHSLWKQKKKRIPYFHFESDIFGIPNWKQLIVKPYICLPQRLTRHVNELTTVL